MGKSALKKSSVIFFAFFCLGVAPCAAESSLEAQGTLNSQPEPILATALGACSDLDPAAQELGQDRKTDETGNTVEPTAPCPSYGSLLARGLILPGWAELAMGEKTEGIAIMASATTLEVAGVGMVAAYCLGWGGGENLTQVWVNSDYPFSSTAYMAEPNSWLLGAAGLSVMAGAALSTYSLWRADQIYAARNAEAPSPLVGCSLLDLALTPFDVSVVLAPDVWPVIALTGVSSLNAQTISSIQSFFEADSQPFWGTDCLPWGAFAMCLLTVAAESSFQTLAEEIFLRGIVLERGGFLASALFEPAYQLLSLVIPSNSAASVCLGAAGSAAYNAYQSGLTLSRGGDFRKSIAIGFWSRCIAETFAYLKNPDAQLPFGLSVTFCY